MNSVKNRAQYIIDASVAVKWFSSEKEEFVAQADEVRKSFLNGSIVLFAPDLIICEIANALLKSKKLDEPLCISAMEILFDIDIYFQSIDGELCKKAFALARQLEITFYDAIYLALAALLNIPLITANPKHHKKQNGIKVINLKDWRG